MKTFNSRIFLNYSTTQLYEMLVGEFNVKFDDGIIIKTNYRELLYSSYCWDLHRHYTNTPLLSIHHVSNVLKGKPLTAKTHMELLTIIFKTVSETNVFKDELDRDKAVRMIYEITNSMYNDMIIKAQSFVVSLDILDFIDVMEHPIIKPVLDGLERTSASISNSYKVIMDVVSKSSDLDNNAIAKASRSKLINNSQLLQCIGPRGSLTDIDSMIFSTPITRGYAKGLIGLYDSMIESRSAAKSLFFSEDPLKDAEYFSRRLQLLCMPVENLHHVDCGSKDYLLWNIKPPIIDASGNTTYQGDLAYMIGKWYLDEDTNTLKSINYSDTHLFGKTIKLRSIISGCHHPDPHGVCAICFGKMADNVPPDSNLGHNCAGTMTQQTSQGVLSTKHYDGNALVDFIILSTFEKNFLRVGTDGNSYYLNDGLKERSIKLYVNCEEAFGLNDITIVNQVEDINLSRISRIDYIGLEQTITTKGNKSLDMSNLKVSFNGRQAMMSYEFLKYVKENKWYLDGKSNFVFDMKDWDFNKPILKLPNRQYNLSEHAGAISDIIEARVDDIQERSKVESPSSTLVELFDAVNSKLNVNLSLLEVIMYASMVVNSDEDDYSLPKPGSNRSLGVASMTIPRRSMGAALAYEGIYNMIINPMSFFPLKRMKHPSDAFLMPHEVVKALHHRK